MLFLKPLFTVNRVTVFGDHADKDQFYYLPENPRISTGRDGRPAFTFLKYLRDITDNPAFAEGQSLGGGFAIFTVDLSLDEETQGEIMSRARRFGSSSPRLASAPFHAGEVRLVALDSAEDPESGKVRFVERVEGSTTPSLFGDLRATFSLRLSQEGAELLEQAFVKGGQPIGVVYDVKFTGLRPAFDITIHADYKRIYNEFNAQVGAQYMMFRAEIEAGFQKLEQDKSLQVIVNTFDTDAQTLEAKNEAMRFLKEQILKDLFTPSLPLPQAQSSDMLAGLTNLLQMAQPGGRSLASRAPLAAPPTQAPAAGVSQLANAPPTSPPHPATDETEGTSPAALATTSPRNPAQQASAPQSAPVSSAPAAGAGAGGGAPAAPSTGAGAGGSGLAVGFKLRFVRQEELTTLRVSWKEASAVERTHSPNGSFGVLLKGLKKSEHFQEIDLDSTFFQRLKVDVQSPAPFVALGLSEAKVHLEYGDRGDGQPRHVDDLELRPDGNGQIAPQIFTSSLDPAKNLDFRHRVDYFFRPDSEWRAQRTHYKSVIKTGLGPSATVTVVPEDDVGFLKVQAEAVGIDFAAIPRVEVRIGYDDGPNDFHVVDTFVVTQQDPTFDWAVRLSDPTRRDWWHELTFVLKDNQRLVRPRVVATSQAMVTGLAINPPWTDRIQLLVDAIMDADTARMILELSYEDPANGYRFSDLRRISKPEEAFFNLEIPVLDPALRMIRYRVTAIDRSNNVRRGDFVETEDTFIAMVAPA